MYHVYNYTSITSSYSRADKLPIIHVPEKKDFKQLLKQYLKEHDKPLKPIKSRSKNPVSEHIHCPCCNAPHNYIYGNTGGRGQFWCKVCDTHFNRHNYLDNPIELHCYKSVMALMMVLILIYAYLLLITTF